MSGLLGSSQWMYATDTGYNIGQSLRFNQSDQPSLTKTYSTAQTNTKIITVSVWVKRGDLGRRNSIMFAKSGSSGWFTFDTDDKLRWNPYNTGYNAFKSTRVFRDTSAWYHIVATADSDTQSGANIYNVYVNGEQLTNSDGSTHVPDDTATKFLANGITTYIGDDTDASTYHHDGYLAEMHVIDGSVVAHTEFGETVDGVWVPKEYSGSYGNNGFYLSFADSSAIGDDLSGNTNDFTATNLAASDVVTDSPTNSFPTLNPLQVSSSITLAEGNLKSTTTNTASSHQAYSNMNIPTSGKWYFECYAVLPRADDLEFGISEIPTPDDRNANHLTSMLYNASADACAILNNSAGNLSIRQQSGTGTLASSITGSTGDIYQIAFDCDTGKVFLGRNNTYYRVGAADGDPASGTNPSKTITANKEYFIGLSCYGGNGAGGGIVNYGQDSTFAGAITAGGNADANGIGDFAYAPPSGFLALCSSNLPEPTIGPNSTTQADDNFNTVLYTGDGSNGQAITGVGFQPDWLWIKSRSGTAYHELHDSVRGAGTRLFSNDTAAESTVGTVSSFDTDGFTVSRNSAYDGTNQNSVTFVGWNWKAGGTASSNSNGSITSSVSANQDAGFSIVSYTGTGSNATVGHGLSSAPEFVIVKERDGTGQWSIQSTSLSAANKVVHLQSTAAEATKADHFNSTFPTSTVFSVGTSGNTNGNTNPFIAYCFHSVDGYSKVGSYKGNASTNGPFVYTGFRPAWLMIKNTANVTHWALWDTKRNTYNVSTTGLYPSSSDGDQTGTALYVDFLSNGFKWRSSHNSVNGSSDTFIYLAFAEAPFKHANAR